jgi:hypothetical protein
MALKFLRMLLYRGSRDCTRPSSSVARDMRRYVPLRRTSQRYDQRTHINRSRGSLLPDPLKSPDRGRQVRSRLVGGGRGIRTLGPPRDRDNGSPFDRSGTSPCCGRVNEIRIRKYRPACFAFATRGRPLLGHPGNAGDDRIPFLGSRYSAKSRSRNLPSSRNSAARPV